MNQIICGIDEAGRGPLAGPVTAAAVILPDDFEIELLNDSKKLSEKKRFVLEELIKQKSIAWSVIHIPHNIIDEINSYYNQSNNYFAGTYDWNLNQGIGDTKAEGMKIDLQYGFIDAYKLKISSNNILINSSGDTDPLFVVRASVGENKYKNLLSND